MSQQDIIKDLIENGYAPVNLVALFDANLLIRPELAQDQAAGFMEYPKIVKNFTLDGDCLATLAEIFGISTQPFETKRSNGNQGQQHLKHTDFQPIIQTLSVPKDTDDPIQLLYVKEADLSLKLFSFYKDGTVTKTSYKGRYKIHWRFTEENVKEG